MPSMPSAPGNSSGSAPTDAAEGTSAPSRPRRSCRKDDPPSTTDELDSTLPPANNSEVAAEAPRKKSKTASKQQTGGRKEKGKGKEKGKSRKRKENPVNARPAGEEGAEDGAIDGAADGTGDAAGEESAVTASNATKKLTLPEMLGKVLAGEDVSLSPPSKIAIGLNALSIASRVKETQQLTTLNDTAKRMAASLEELVKLQRGQSSTEPMDVDM